MLNCCSSISVTPVTVAHRTRQFEEWLADSLETFKRRHETIIMRIPRAVREVSMAEFAKYNGDIQECLKALTKGMLGGEVSAIDKNSRKRKWIASQEAELEKLDAKSGSQSHDRESSRGVKSGMACQGCCGRSVSHVDLARIIPSTPKRTGPASGPGTAQRARSVLPKTPATVSNRKSPPISY